MFKARGFVMSIPDGEVAPLLEYIARCREEIAPEELDYHELLLALLLVGLEK